MKITLTLDRSLVLKVRQIAAQREMTFTQIVREQLEHVLAEETASVRQSELERLEQSFAKFQFKVGKHVWRRDDLHTRC